VYVRGEQNEDNQREGKKEMSYVISV